MSFSEREGLKKPKHNPLESMDSGLKNAIWTVLYTQIDNCYISRGCTGYGDTTYCDTKAKSLWTDYFEQNISRLPSAEKYLNEIEKLYFKLEWHEVYGLIEHVLKQDKHFSPEKFNKVLTEYNAAYRIINSIVQPISDENIIKNMEAAKDSSLSQEVREHLYKAQTLLSHKKYTDFNNSCLESIKAVEGTCRIIVGNEKILGDNIKEIKKLNFNQHVVAILEKINAFRNDVSAHATKKHGYLPTREDAILMHTLCCGFVNYFKSKDKK